MKTFEFDYGHGTKKFQLDEERIIDVLKTADFPPIKNLKEAVHEALYHPIGLPPIDQIVKPGQTIAFICNDLTRVANSFEFMPLLLDEMNKLGVPDENMKIIFSLGTHREMTPAEWEEAVGKEVANRVKMYNSICDNQEDFEYFGTTAMGTPVWLNKQICDVDHVFMTGSIVQHFFSGFGGGRKAILPGCAAMETIRHNHSFMMKPEAVIGKLDDNPCYEDQIQGVALFAKDHSLFLFNVVMDAHHHILKIFAGDYIKAHRQACEFVEKVYSSEIEQQADIVIASCGGFPKDINIYQMQKTMDNAVCATKKGGAVIIFAECIEGSGNKTLEETFNRLGSTKAIKEELEKDFKIGEHKAYALSRLMEKAHFYLVTAVDKGLANKMLFAGAFDTFEEALEAAEKQVGKGTIILMPEGSLTVPKLKEKNSAAD
ncbi:MAG: nickel-dependent lactate racemase [Burkholderiales bacterium]|nr:nickel-dependent lactate racemase [Burkholderiales bacterium]